MVTIQYASIGHRFCHPFSVGFVLYSLLVPGCGSGVYESAPVDANKARATLTAAMEGWKSGESVEALRSRSPSIVIQDRDWSGGNKLLKYEMIGDGKEVDANLIARVKLTLEDSQGATTEKTVQYVVGTAPVLTIFRDFP